MDVNPHVGKASYRGGVMNIKKYSIMSYSSEWDYEESPDGELYFVKDIYPLLSELAELRAYKEAAEKQDPYGYFLPDQGGNVFTREIGNCKIAERFNWQIVNLYAKPVPADKPARITEQDAREIINTYIDNKIGVPVNEWLKPLLNKLNADREQVPTNGELLRFNSQKPVGRTDGSGNLKTYAAHLPPNTDIYAEQVPAVAVSDGWRESLTEMVQAMRQYEMDVDGKAPEKHRAMMDRAETLLAAPSHSQQSAPTDSGVVELDSLCEKYNRKEIDIVGLTSRIWNSAYWEGKKFGETLSDRCPSHESEQHNQQTEGE